MRHGSNLRSRGVALILVLMITAVLGLLMLQFSLTAKEHTRRAQRLLDRATADLQMRSTTSALLFEMATRTWETKGSVDALDFPGEPWNFGGRSFTFLEGKVEIQDLSGLIPLPQPGETTGRLSRILQVAGVPEDEARRAAQKIGAMQAPPNWTPLQDLYELGVVADLSAAQIHRLARVGTLYPAGSFNPGTATSEALATLHSGSALQGLAELRARDELGQAAYRGIAGPATDDSVLFYPGPGFRITTRVSFGAAVAEEDLTLSIDPYSPAPFSIWSRRRPNNLVVKND
jgi:type II secretory pathway component PulK